ARDETPAVGKCAAGVAATVFVSVSSGVIGTRKVAAAVLSAVTGSGIEEATVAELVSVVSVATTVALMVTVAVAFGARSPRSQCTPVVHVPWLETTETSV